jgi:hypothetical protein
MAEGAFILSSHVVGSSALADSPGGGKGLTARRTGGGG